MFSEIIKTEIWYADRIHHHRGDGFAIGIDSERLPSTHLDADDFGDGIGFDEYALENGDGYSTYASGYFMLLERGVYYAY